MAELRYEACTICAEQRKRNDFIASCCSWCSGTGMRLVSYVCNGCGCTIDSDLGLANLKVNGYYESTHLNDCTAYEFSLCEQCLRKLFDGMVVPPDVHEDHEGMVTYKEDRECYAQTLWHRDIAGRRRKLAAGLCTHTEWCRDKAIWRVYYSSNLSDHAVCEQHADKTKNTLNADLVPADALRGIWSIEQTEQQRWIAASEWLRTQAPKEWPYMPDCLQPLTNVTDGTRTFWYPSRDVTALWDTENSLKIADGTLVWKS